jgi:hypothetical protein
MKRRKRKMGGKMRKRRSNCRRNSHESFCVNRERDWEKVVINNKGEGKQQQKQQQTTKTRVASRQRI